MQFIFKFSALALIVLSLAQSTSAYYPCVSHLTCASQLEHYEQRSDLITKQLDQILASKDTNIKALSSSYKYQLIEILDRNDFITQTHDIHTSYHILTAIFPANRIYHRGNRIDEEKRVDVFNERALYLETQLDRADEKMIKYREDVYELIGCDLRGYDRGSSSNLMRAGEMYGDFDMLCRETLSDDEEFKEDDTVEAVDVGHEIEDEDPVLSLFKQWSSEDIDKIIE